MPQSVFMEPSNPLSNKYYENLATLIKNSGFKVRPATDFWDASIFHKPTKQIVIISWIEDRVARPTFLQCAHEFLLSLFKIVLIKLFRHKLVWIKHNYQPHALSQSVFPAQILNKTLLLILSWVANLKLAHSQSFCAKNQDFVYLPHPRYKIGKVESTKEVEFLVFGRLMRYKGIVELLEHWPEELQLKIVGNPENAELQSDIEFSIKRRNLLVDFEPRFLSLEELDNLLTRTRCVICSNVEDSMIASGVMIHALSAGCFVLARYSEFAGEMVNNEFAVGTFKQLPDITKMLPNLDFSKMDNQYKQFSISHGDNVLSCEIEKLFSD